MIFHSSDTKVFAQDTLMCRVRPANPLLFSEWDVSEIHLQTVVSHLTQTGECRLWHHSVTWLGLADEGPCTAETRVGTQSDGGGARGRCRRRDEEYDGLRLGIKGWQSQGDIPRRTVQVDWTGAIRERVGLYRGYNSMFYITEAHCQKVLGYISVSIESNSTKKTAGKLPFLDVVIFFLPFAFLGGNCNVSCGSYGPKCDGFGSISTLIWPKTSSECAFVSMFVTIYCR